MTDTYTPPEVWTWEAQNGGTFASTNRPIAGATHDKELPVGEHPFQLHSLATPNGVKVNIMFEELLEAGYAAEYDAWPIRIGDGDQFGSGFVEINPNSKIPALIDRSGDKPVRVFESAAILMHLSEKFDNAFQVKDPGDRAEMLSWLFWQMGSAPYLGGGFGHFYAYAPEKWQYPIDRFAMEVKRQLDVLDRHLADKDWMAGGTYTIADIAIWPWYGNLVLGRQYNAGKFLDVDSYTNVVDWAKRIDARPAVQRGRKVNRLFGEPETQLHERHAASDFDTKTQDKLESA
ncbi:glutathione-dependent disulfide-bond oxidoreductase [Marinovum sp. 2_MG-2023]|uniref:glutathione-dependent disulfide-bond oxidoreductase n=1 Tax=unclassified Marinovum TaxID=2647166 RepID=UPI0026E42334|nr:MULTISPECIES: glutathione-dependent disulfide-bond oxidoreductase [unclassified Marinovum]MDO6728819.1 glutathione-dependent disulfide-bond oxidoreductase [Marinovum sp. 2_MG-2023]MDO6777765.1 glutathione-dependent disulfide-bond oxidoreductase [Marinovum sp. 1_MG-2023]